MTEPLMRIQELVIDIPAQRDVEIARFYAALLGYDGAEDAATNPRNPLLTKEAGIDLGLQRVQQYQPPTWPTQQRGAQMHLDLDVADLEAAVAAAVAIGASEAAEQYSDDSRVMLDPAGHPFCLEQDAETAGSPPGIATMGGIVIDSREPRVLARFYHGLIGGSYVEHTLWAGVEGATTPNLYFQPVPNLQPGTWPTQERGQQMHFDCAVRDVEAVKAKVNVLGGRVLFESAELPGFAIVADPDGHPFCINEGRTG